LKIGSLQSEKIIIGSLESKKTGSLELKIGSLQSEKIIIGSLESKKTGSL